MTAPVDATRPGEVPIRTSWLIRDDFERARFREMHARLTAANVRLLALVVVAMLVTVPIQPPKSAYIVGLGGVAIFGVVQRIATRLPRPEAWVLVGLLGALTSIPVGLACYASAQTPAMVLVAWPLSGITGRYNNRVTAVAVAYAAAVVTAALLVPDPGLIARDPISVLLPVVALVAVAVNCSVLRRGDIASRGAAIVDPLTGMLNRAALDRRVEEIEHQSHASQQPVSVIVLDLDHFKAINDTHGHTTGDAVLRDVAYAIRRELRAYDQGYRIGGEEFVVLLPGVDLTVATEVAERVRAAIAANPISGLSVRASLGVAGSPAGEPFAWDSTFARADSALYRAKQQGRDRVVVAGPAAPASTQLVRQVAGEDSSGARAA
jgi:diguanylate cyclase (GGDEF)-like protein